MGRRKVPGEAQKSGTWFTRTLPARLGDCINPVTAEGRQWREHINLSDKTVEASKMEAFPKKL